MKKLALLLSLLLLISCTQVEEKIQTPNTTTETQITPVNETAPTIETRPSLNENITKYIIQENTKNFKLISTDATHDNFGAIQVERYDGRYQSDTTVIAQIFKFSTKEELETVLKSEFYDIINKGMTRRLGNTIATYLSQENHRIIVWTNEDKLIFIDAVIPDYLEREIIDVYLVKYPSDLKTDQCIDTDSDDHLTKGTTTKVKINSTEIEFTDVCLRDFEYYKNKQYTPQKSLSKDTVLEGRCENDFSKPGYIEEYVCPKGCEDGACKN